MYIVSYSKLVFKGDIMEIPEIEIKSRPREFNAYSFEEQFSVLKAYLFDNLSYRKIDTIILNFNNPDDEGWKRDTKGFQSWAIINHLGLGKFKGIFYGMTIEDAIMEIKAKNNPSYSELISILENNLLHYDFIEEDIEAETAIEFTVLKEGKKKEIFTTQYERNPKLRKQAVQIHGTTCMACGFNFKEFYGERGADYIEVHHIRPLAQRNEEVEIDPSNDLIVLCANCHRMIHRKKNDILSLEELKTLIRENMG